MQRRHFASIAVTVFVLPTLTAAASTCENLISLTNPNATVTAASLVEVESGHAAYCRVLATARPVEDSEIRIEVWLPPAESWNGKFLGTGNGGYSGDLSYPAMRSGLNQGYATAGCDTGHQGGDLKFGVGHPEKINDWAYRAVHVMTETAKLVIHNYYGKSPDHAYFTGCSTGGQQALSEAQRYPADYDGIVAGAPGNNRVRLNVGFFWSWLAFHRDSANDLPKSKLAVLYRAVMAGCDAIDGLKDDVIDDPRKCTFDPTMLLCRGADADDCLTAAQADAVRKVYDGARNPRTQERLFAGWARGSEAPTSGPMGGWSGYFVGQPEPARIDFWRYWVFDNPNWDPRTFDFDRDIRYADARLAPVSAIDPNLTEFKRRNGRIIMYHGWADPVVPPEDGIRYYESVVRAMGGTGNTSDFFRLFMAPGMAHCGGGPGPNAFDALSALDAWVTTGTAPNKMVASHAANGRVDRTRPLCPYPKVARWDGKGSTEVAESFACTAPK